MKFIIAAGGTGGHIYPGIAIAQELRAKDPKNQVLFIGSKEGLEKKLVEKEGFKIKLVFSRGLLRKISWKAISSPFLTLIGLFQSIVLLLSFRPAWVIATGGYVSLPVILAARVCKVKVLLHEQNILPGITNRFCQRFATKTALSFKDSLKYLKGYVTGNPVRKQILNAQKKKNDNFTILVLGGSQGARSINKAISEKLDYLKDLDVNLVHISGERDYRMLAAKKYHFYKLIPYLYNIEEALCAADLVISRAGATALAEILVLGIPAILVPFPYSAEGHQDLNAAYLEKRGAARVIRDNQLNQLIDIIIGLKKDKSALDSMARAAKSLAKPLAGQEIVKIIYNET